MITNSITDVINILSSHNYSKEEINFILDRRNLYDIDKFLIYDNSNILYSEDHTLFCDTLITFDKDNVINFNYDYFSLKTHTLKSISYIRNDYNFLDEIVYDETTIKKDLMNYLNYTYTVTKTSFIDFNTIFKYYINENIYNSDMIEKVVKSNKTISLTSFDLLNITPAVKYIYSAERCKTNPNLVKWKYIDNNNSLSGKNVCDFENNLQNLMDISIYDKVNKNEYKKILKQNKSANLIKVD